MTETLFITIVGEILLPVMLLVWLCRGRRCRGLEWLLRTLAFFAYLGLIVVVGTWLLVPWYLPYGYALLGLGAAAASWRRAGHFRSRPDEREKSNLQIASTLGLAIFCIALLFWALGGYAPPEGPSVSLAPPLKGGTFYVVNGGYSILINPHMKTLARKAFSAYRAQSYAIDVVRIDRFGRRAQGLWPADPGRYLIFGQPVYAPCAGVVIQTENQLPDQKPPETDPGHPAGNFVRLGCGEAEILLAHLMHASLTVSPGDWVQTGQLLGRVGNSGLSTEPHLHLHAQHSHPEGGFLAGKPMPVWIDGRILVRNSRLSFGD
jgi:hypothetical protein